MFLLRSVRHEDFSDLLALSRELNTVNLPSRPRDIRKMIGRSVRSFAGEFKDDRPRAQYLFVMEDTEKHQVIGTSKIFAQHGTPQRPHLYFQVMQETVRSKSLGLHFRRRFYRFKSDSRGYTEIGGLVLDPRYRRRPERLGKQLSFVRFLFMAAHPGFFKRKVIAELLPPIHKGVGSTLYNFYGYQLTRLPYRKADLLSFKNKEFILKLFPRSDLYHDILPPEVKADIGKTGPGSTAARDILSKIGFRYVDQIDPFDGGPYDVAFLKEISVVRETEEIPFGGIFKGSGPLQLVMAESEGMVRALLTRLQKKRGKLFLPPAAVELLSPKIGQTLYTYRW